MSREIFEVKLPQPGRNYSMRIVDVGSGFFRTGTPYVRISFEITENESGDCRVVEKFPTDGRGVAFLMPLLRACRIDVSRGRFSVDADDLLGKIVVADLVEDSFEGATRLRVRNIRPSTSQADGGPQTTSPSDDKGPP